MTTFSPRDTIRLPVWHDDDGYVEEVVDAYEVLSQPYVDGINKVEIQPYRYGPTAQDPWRLVAVGLPYTIRPGHLTRLIVRQHDQPVA